MDKVSGKRDFGTAWWLVFITMLCVMGMSFLTSDIITEKNHYMISFVSEMTIILPILIGYLLMFKRKELKETGFRKFPNWMIPILMILPIAAQTFINTLTLPVTYVMDKMFAVEEATAAIPQGGTEWIFALLTLCVAAPVLEEILCRGILMYYLKDYGVVICLVMSSLAFTLLHFSPSSFFVIFFLGLLLGIIRLVTNSLWASIIAHAANNFVAFSLSLMPNISEQMNMIMIIASLVLFPLLLYLFLKFSPSKNRTLIQYKPKKYMKISIGQILCFSIYGLYACGILMRNILEFMANVLYWI